MKTAACAPQRFMDSLSGRLGAEDAHMEAITQLQETDFLSAPLLVWRGERENGERGQLHVFVFAYKQRNRMADLCIERFIKRTYFRRVHMCVCR